MLDQKILVADEDPDFAHLLREKMESFGLECYAFSSLEGLLKGIGRVKPDLVILSLPFAQSYGELFAEHIDPYLAPQDVVPPVMILNGDDDDCISQYAFELGAVAIPGDHWREFQGMLQDYMPETV